MAIKKNKPFMVMSVDVEALPARADVQHVKKLIWGQFEGYKTFGLREIMQEAEAVNAQLTCFLDYAEKDIYGSEIDKVAREIISSGHDLQLHLHPEILSERFWGSQGIDKPTIGPNRWEEGIAKIPFEYYVREFADVKGEYPKAFRAGSFRSNLGQIMAMKKYGIPISSNMAFSAYQKQGRQPVGCADDFLYKHFNGVLEIPVTQIQAVDDRWLSLIFPWPKRAKEDMDKAFEELSMSNRPITVLLLHSWNLLEHPENGKGYFGPGNEINKISFRSMMRSAAKYFEIISFENIAKNKINDFSVHSQFVLSRSESSLTKENIKGKNEKKETISSNVLGERKKKNLDNRIYGLVIGGMRCGTTASFTNLCLHPEICAADRKEVHYFSSDENWAKGYAWYKKQWSKFNMNEHSVCLESCTHYSKYPIHKDVPKRMSEIEQDVRIIYLVRDPIERAESHLAFQMGKGYLRASDKQKRSRFLTGIATQYSSYYYQIEQYLKYFSKDKIHVVIQEEMKNEPDKVYPKLFKFLSVDDMFKFEQKILNDRNKYIKKDADGASVRENYILTYEEKVGLFNAIVLDVDKFIKEFDLDVFYWKTYNAFKA